VIKSRGMRLAEQVVRMRKMRNPYTNFIGKPEGKRPLERSRRRWENNIRMDLGKTGWEGVDRMHVNRDQWLVLVNTIMNLRVP
jgi:hypothetical protein